jgi:hypothetical protein
MKELVQNGKTYCLPSILSPFQEKLYIHLIDWKRKYITTESGKAHGCTYDAILPDNIGKQRPLVYPEIRSALEEHLQRFPFRIHKYFNHMASSQLANINLFLPILRHQEVDAILGEIKPDLARLATEYLDYGYQIEFSDGKPGSLGDKTNVSGTDSDIAIAYYNHNGTLCLWLIEHKLTETEFTECGGFRSKGRLPQHDCNKSFAELVECPSACYYHDAKMFNYWKITSANREFFPNYNQSTGCPFRGGMNQLWRNQLLGLAIEQDKNQAYQQVTFSIVRHPRNCSLDKTICDYQALINGNSKFTSLTSADIISAATANADGQLLAWVKWYRELYAV